MHHTECCWFSLCSKNREGKWCLGFGRAVCLQCCNGTMMTQHDLQLKVVHVMLLCGSALTSVWSISIQKGASKCQGFPDFQDNFPNHDLNCRSLRPSAVQHMQYQRSCIACCMRCMECQCIPNSLRNATGLAAFPSLRLM